mgnify:CR=1 FL=1
MNLQAWFTEWADQCKGHGFTLIEPNLRKAAEAFKRVAELEAEMDRVKITQASPQGHEAVREEVGE